MTCVTILMATLDGAAYLGAQLDSLSRQTHCNWRLWVGDDGSRDDTRALVTAFARSHPDREVRVFDGPGRGSALNFLTLLCQPDLPSGPVAFCDQDDVWLRGKLARALRRLSTLPPGPGLYAAESFLTDADLLPRQRSGTGPRGASFTNALVQNLCSGHTLVLNAEAVALARRAGMPEGVVFHDWWLYQLVTGAGGACRLDPLPVALYRQHGGNRIGSGNDPAARVARMARLFRGDFRDWLFAHHAALLQVERLLTPEARAVLQRVTRAPPGRPRAAAFLAAGLARDTRLGTAALTLAALCGRA